MTNKVFPIFPASAAPLWTIVAIVFALVAIIAVFSVIAYSTRNVKFELTDNGLRIRGGIYGKFIPRDVLVREKARVINLNVERDYKPRWRTNGVGLPGYAEGWFRLVNGERALLFVTERSRIVYIPTTEGYSLLLTPSRPEEFLKAIYDWQ
jgi:hypothetical protein